MSKCLPVDDRLTRNLIEETIAEDVDNVEEAEYVAITLLSTVVIFVVSTLIARCVKCVSGSLSTSDNGVLVHRRPVCSDTFKNLR